jgi:hypothetical protein
MKKKYYLQMFAEGEGAGAAGEPAGTGAGASAEGAGEGTTQTNEPLSFDDFLAQGGQAEFDRRINKAVQTAVANAQKKWQTLTDSKVSEAEKLAQMTSEEKEKYRADKAERELADLKRQIALGDMAKTARKMLSDEQITLPDEIIMNLVSDDAEKTKEAVEGFTKAFKEAVNAAVKEALRGNPPKAGTSGARPITREEIMAVKDRAERQKLIAENPQLFVRK